MKETLTSEPRCTHEAMCACIPWKGYRCADCDMYNEPCPECYYVWWRKKHPNHDQIGGHFDAGGTRYLDENGERKP